MASIIENIVTWSDGFDRYRARIEFTRTLSESDNHPALNLDSQWPNLRRRARNAIVKRIAESERKTGESVIDAERRIRATLSPLAVITQDIDSLNRWHGVTFGEVA